MSSPRITNRATCVRKVDAFTLPCRFGGFELNQPALLGGTAAVAGLKLGSSAVVFAEPIAPPTRTNESFASVRPSDGRLVVCNTDHVPG